MYVLAVILVAIGVTAAPVIGFFYPAWRELKGKKPLTEWQQYGVSTLAIGVLLLMGILAWLLINS
ncbi:hypothetical protein [Halobacillus sp. BBL2006]|uniref:hypothetical protein n=1 Tax=Halobacillus sp. BBL2006 TaxID=1543706 RepID=UPI000541BDC5|nr:hypothetical protein [Halobacillus sp. BBL2006]KHE72930.1 hypothetical protein LD39_01970 [Halobacillus sp. BBL2006]